MKTVEQVRADITRRLDINWHTDITADTTSWPHTFPLGQPSKADLDANYGDFHRRKVALQDWSQGQGITLTYANRTVLGTTQPVPTHVTVPDMPTAATISAGDWPTRLHRATTRLTAIIDCFPATASPARLVRAVDRYTDTDFQLLLDVATWFTHNDPTGLTARQVPIPGVHAKWLNTHGRELLALTDRECLGLLPRHPARIHFTYLDPNHRATRGRLHDSATVDDTFTPAYQPRVVVISENKDTAIHFPPIPGGIAIEGDGFGGKTAAKFHWLTGAPHLYYWGDIDAHGYEILNGWRADGVRVTSILMDPATYAAYEPFGTNTDKNGKPLGPGTPKPLPHLTAVERTVYELVLAETNTGHRRIEQERIPLTDALAAITRN